MKLDVAALVVGLFLYNRRRILVCVAVAMLALAQHFARVTVTHLGVIAPVTLIAIGVVGVLASRRNHHP